MSDCAVGAGMRLDGWTAAFVLALWMSLVAPAAAQQGDGRWLRAETANFVVFSQGRESRLREIAQAMEDFDATLRALTNLNAPPSGTKVQVYILRSTGELRVVWPGVGIEVGGFYRAGLEQIAAFVIYEEGYLYEPLEIVFHEYAHHFMLHYFPSTYPSWYVEGWADFVSTVVVEDRIARVGRPSGMRSYSVVAEGLLPVEAWLAPERVERRARDFSERFYAHSWLAASFLANRPERSRGLERYVASLSEGGDPIASFEPAFGITPDAFMGELRQYLRGNTTVRGVRLAAEPPQVTITRMPRAADDLLLRVTRDMIGNIGDATDVAELADALDRAARRHPDDPYAQRATARAALLRANFTGAREILDRIIAANPNDVEALSLAGYSHIAEIAESEDAAVRDAGLRAARRRLVQGFRADANHYPTLYLYALTYTMTDATLTQEQLEVLARAVELAPNVQAVRFLFANELMQAGHFDTAIGVLRPLMYVPHNEELGAEVRKMVEHARRGEISPPPEAEESEETSAAPAN